MWWRIRKWQAERGTEISEAERAVHRGFTRLRGALGQYLTDLVNARTPEAMRRKEARMSRDLAKDIEEIEENIEKEVEDIEKKKPQ